MGQRGSFDYQRHGEAARQAHTDLNAASKEILDRLHKAFDASNRPLYLTIMKEWGEFRKERSYQDLLKSFDMALEAAYPPQFWEDYENLRSGTDLNALETAIEFLEADPYFFRSGYVKENLLRRVRRYTLAPEHIYRLQSVVLNVVDKHFCREFREYCKLARKVDSADFRLQLDSRTRDTDKSVQTRAQWVLDWLAKSGSKGSSALRV